MIVDRRQVLVGMGYGSALTLAATAGFSGLLLPRPAWAQASTEELMVTGPLPDRSIGPADAPVTIIEYASMTCGHCATFHAETYPDLKTRYLDDGRARLIFREFPLDPLASAGFMLARCAAGDDKALADGRAEAAASDQAANDRYFAMVDVLFSQQRTWAYAQDPVTGLFDVVKQAGFTQESFEACLTNQELLDAVNWVKNRAAENFDVRSTPTFFVNGEIARGALSLEDLEKLMQPHLPT